ncbi:sensor histidine kinase [Helicobacter sp. WB40]|uniref:sensor histidine kinase n=1 Tax=Helicobacter sp. WB40 TaxID=3004130 RepID=UPI0022EBFFA3|nr:HAMP domain-containing sensor histidine kinase [Helicobacter sp. WB40]MDA3966363.1 HAMP domain-containing sensor histidine kinase [Helicobacter sp. WB40]
MNEVKKVALNISLLYALTSFVFLLLVFYIFYEQQERDLLERRTLEVRDVLRELEGSLHDNYENFTEIIDLFSKENNIKVAITREDGKIVYNNTFLAREKIQDFIYKDTGNLVLYKGRSKLVISGDNALLITHRFEKGFNEYLKMHYGINKNGNFFIVVVSGGIKSEFIQLFSVLLVSFLISLVMIGFVAYLLVKFSLKPLGDKIETLNKFIRDSTHELNTPLSAILMSVERIKVDKLDKQDLIKLERIKTAAKSLENMYQDLIFYSFPHLQDKNLEDINMEILIKERVEYFRVFFEKKNINLSLEASQSFLKAHKSGIVRVIDNLLDNALKYTSSGGNVSVKLANNTLEISDNGCGIDEELIPRIFERYYRANGHQGGFGIGLSLVMDICNKYNIKIICNSIKGNGTTFKLNWNAF